MKNLLLIILLLSNAAMCIAYPITPRPLRQLIVESPYIVAGKVISITQLEREPNSYFPEAIAKIELTQVFKGEVFTKFVEVHFDDYYGCPSPPRYRLNTNVIAFLDFKEAKFRTHALSYGIKELDTNEMAIYSMRILEMQQILKLTNQVQQYQQTVDWLIACAENQTTKWEGVFELAPQSDFMSFYSEADQVNFGQFLSKDQKDRLFAILKKSETFSYGDFGIIDLVYAGNEKFIDDRTVNSMKKLDLFELIFADQYMLRLKHLVPPIEFAKMILKQKDLAFGSDNERKQRKNIDAFIAAIVK